MYPTQTHWVLWKAALVDTTHGWEAFLCKQSHGTLLKKSSGAWTTHTNKHLQNTTFHHSTSPSGASGSLKPSVGSSLYFSYHISVLHRSNLEKHPTRRNNLFIWDFCRRWEIPLPLRTLALLSCRCSMSHISSWYEIQFLLGFLVYVVPTYLTDQGH